MRILVRVVIDGAGLDSADMSSNDLGGGKIDGDSPIRQDTKENQESGTCLTYHIQILRYRQIYIIHLSDK